MARLREPEGGLVFASVIFNADKFDMSRLLDEWTSRYGEANTFNPSYNPSLAYYSKEMGENLQRTFLWCDGIFERQELVEGKLWADGLEQMHSENGQRSVNIDIGMLFKEQALLATSKPYAHRIYLKSGVHAELTYTYENKSYQFLPWTYPDYRHEEKLEFFNSLRLRLFQKNLKKA